MPYSVGSGEKDGGLRPDKRADGSESGQSWVAFRFSLRLDFSGICLVHLRRSGCTRLIKRTLDPVRSHSRTGFFIRPMTGAYGCLGNLRFHGCRPHRRAGE